MKVLEFSNIYETIWNKKKWLVHDTHTHGVLCTQGVNLSERNLIAHKLMALQIGEYTGDGTDKIEIRRK